MPSARLVTLQEQLGMLRAHMLPAQFDPTGNYDDAAAVSTRALGYRVLAHAEIEAYFEDRALDVSNQARQVWEISERVSRTSLCLLGFSGKEMGLPPDSLEAPSENKRKSWPALVDIGARLGPVLTAFHYRVTSENHGVKERNLLSLLLPIGLDHKKIDPTFLADIDSFGALRGLAAHSSSKNAVQQLINPADELKRVEALMPGIFSLDVEIDALLAQMA